MRMRISKAVPQGRGLRSLKRSVFPRCGGCPSAFIIQILCTFSIWKVMPKRMCTCSFYPNTVHFFNLEGYANTHVHLYVPQRCCTLYGAREFGVLGSWWGGGRFGIVGIKSCFQVSFLKLCRGCSFSVMVLYVWEKGKATRLIVI